MVLIIWARRERVWSGLREVKVVLGPMTPLSLSTPTSKSPPPEIMFFSSMYVPGKAKSRKLPNNAQMHSLFLEENWKHKGYTY